MKVRLTLECSEAQYEDQGDGAPVPPEQPQTLDLGEFDLDFIQLTYNYLRIGPDGDHIAAYSSEDGFWRVAADGFPLVKGRWKDYPIEDGKFSDITIGAA